MKIWEIEWVKGKKYKADGKVFKVGDGHENELYDGCYDPISDFYTTKELIDLDFEECFDWSTVAVDTPVWVWDDDVYYCFKSHFCKFNENAVHKFGVFVYGKTSHTNSLDITANYKNCSLTEPKKEK